MRPANERLYRVKLWTGGEPGRGTGVQLYEQPGFSAEDCRARTLARARKLFPFIDWAVGVPHWRRDLED